MIYFRIGLFLIGLVTFSLGITIAIKVQHLGIHPWDVLTVGLYDLLGLSVGTWNIIIGIMLIIVSLILDRRYVKVGTFLNAIEIVSFVDLFLCLDFLHEATDTWTDIIIIIIGIMLIIVSLILDRRYVKVDTFLNVIVIGSFVDLFLWLDFLHEATHTWTDIIIILIGIVVMGVGGGVYNAAGVGSGPRDGF